MSTQPARRHHRHSSVRRGIPVAVGVMMLAACSTAEAEPGASGTNQPVPTSPAPSDPPTTTITTTTITTTTVPTARLDTSPPSTAARPSPTWPLQGLPLDPASELDIGIHDLRGLTWTGEWFVAATPPDRALRISEDESVEPLDLGLGGEGMEWMGLGDRMWATGGPYRDVLIEIDVDAWDVVREIRLDNDHSVARATPDTVWLKSAKWIQPVDARTGELLDRVVVEVEPGDIAVTENGDVWVSLPLASELLRIGADGATDRFDVPAGPGPMTVDDEILWVSHPALSSVSRIDIGTGEVVDLVDLELSRGEVVSTRTGWIDATADGVWVMVVFPGSEYDNALVLLHRGTGEVIAARSVPFESFTWEAVDGAVWVHRAERGSMIRAGVDDLTTASPVDPGDLLPPLPETTTSDPATMQLSAEQLQLRSAFEELADFDRPSSELDLGDLGPVRDRVNELGANLPSPEVVVTDVGVDGDDGTVTFDVLIENDVVAFRGIMLEWERREGAWRVVAASYCRFASGVGVDCPATIDSSG